MANKRDIDYLEIDRILNGLFTPVEMNSNQENSRGNGHFKLYEQVSNRRFYYYLICYL